MRNKRCTTWIFSIPVLFALVALLIAGCGSFSIQGQSQSGDDPGITITGDTGIFTDESQQAEEPTSGENTAQLLLTLAGFGVILLIAFMLIRRSSGHSN